MTIIAATPTTPQHTELLTAFDVLDIQCALQNAAATDTATLNAHDRQALALLTYWDKLPSATRVLISWLADPARVDVTLPVTSEVADRLLSIAAELPPVTPEETDAWLAAHDTEPCDVERMTAALVAYVAEHGSDVGGGHMRLMLNAALLAVARPDITADEAVRMVAEDSLDLNVRRVGTIAHDMVARAQRDRLTAIDDEAAAVAL
ncbi:hypothetical protein [Nonomuraea gerenzanensis]|uniref:Uncharacterized protein n=1 Tax=Nonomuraea gerenzanensis TaxID=93944 RepID=A0A1M4BLA1_9ACTN|nr:hypothetical protein [Nonomuraea gerenzanensis]UBU09990.1 hypothetical protein LCN96_37315 [Nonomuraea gerenzanensis]SAP16301.1 hypothetical protein BN4615_P10964 [Nonomuraea gerenzanensis]